MQVANLILNLLLTSNSSWTWAHTTFGSLAQSCSFADWKAGKLKKLKWTHETETGSSIRSRTKLFDSFSSFKERKKASFSRFGISDLVLFFIFYCFWIVMLAATSKLAAFKWAFSTSAEKPVPVKRFDFIVSNQGVGILNC